MLTRIARAALATGGLAIATPLVAQDPNVEEVVVLGVRERLQQAGSLKNVIERTEVIGASTLEATHAVSLTDALSEAPGAHISNDCSMCGLKRIRLKRPQGLAHHRAHRRLADAHDHFGFLRRRRAGHDGC